MAFWYVNSPEARALSVRLRTDLGIRGARSTIPGGAFNRLTQHVHDGHPDWTAAIAPALAGITDATTSGQLTPAMVQEIKDLTDYRMCSFVSDLAVTCTQPAQVGPLIAAKFNGAAPAKAQRPRPRKVTPIHPTFTADRAVFCEAARKVATFVADRPAYPVLGGILIEARDGSVTVTATDLEETGQAAIPAEVTRPFRMLLWADTLARICRHLAGPEITATLGGSTATLVCGPSTYRLLTMPEDDYPISIPAPSDLSAVRPAQPSGRDKNLGHSQMFLAGFKLTARRPPRAKELYAPTDLAPGAWITWKRRTADDETADVTGQVWAAAPGKRTVWALAEGERPVKVTERTYGLGSYSDGTYQQYTRLEEIADENPPASDDAPAADSTSSAA